MRRARADPARIEAHSIDDAASSPAGPAIFLAVAAPWFILDTTRVPFGKVVAPIGLHRVALPGPAPAACPAGTIRHDRAVLHRDDGLAYSLVSECYTRANLGR